MEYVVFNRALLLYMRRQAAESFPFFLYLVKDPITWSTQSIKRRKIRPDELIQTDSRSRELEKSEPLSYLRQTSNLTTSGSVLGSGISAALICREYQNPGMLEMFGRFVNQQQQTLSLINVRDEHDGYSFGTLFKHFLRLGAVAIGLYRSGANVRKDELCQEQHHATTDMDGETRDDDLITEGKYQNIIYCAPDTKLTVTILDGIYVITRDLKRFLTQLDGEHDPQPL